MPMTPRGDRGRITRKRGPFNASALHLTSLKPRTQSATKPKGTSWSGVHRHGELQLKLMSKPAIRVSEAEAANDFRSLLARVRAGAEVVIEQNAEAVAVLRPAAPNVRLLSASLHLATERSSNTTLDGEFGRDLEAVISSHREPLTPPAWD